MSSKCFWSGCNNRVKVEGDACHKHGRRRAVEPNHTMNAPDSVPEIALENAAARAKAKAAAESMVGSSHMLSLIKQILIKHETAVFEVMHEQVERIQVLEAALQAMVSAQQAGPITDEMHKAWAHARELLSSNAPVERRGEAPSA